MRRQVFKSFAQQRTVLGQPVHQKVDQISMKILLKKKINFTGKFFVLLRRWQLQRRRQQRLAEIRRVGSWMRAGWVQRPDATNKAMDGVAADRAEPCAVRAETSTWADRPLAESE